MEVDIQKIVLASLIIDNSIHDKVIPMLKAEYFTGKNGSLFAVIFSLYKLHLPIDQISILKRFDECVAWSKLEIIQLSDELSSSANVMYYIQLLKDEYIRRQMNHLWKIKTEPNEDPSDKLGEVYSKVKQLVEDAVIATSKPIVDICEKALNEIDIEKNTVGLLGVPTPLGKMNSDTRGWRHGELIIIAGRPGMGKTAFALDCARSACEYGKRVAYFSMEMKDTELVKRLMRGFEDSEFGAGEISKWDLHIFDRGGIDVGFVKSSVRILGGVDLVIIDYLGLMKMNGYKKKTEAIGEITGQLKAFSLDDDVPVMLLSQLNRNVESRSGWRHELSDLRESGDIEQDADKVIFISRPELCGVDDIEGTNTHNMAIIQKEKDRNGKPQVYFRSRVNETVTKFYDWDEFS